MHTAAADMCYIFGDSFVQPLSHLDAKILNKDGETPLHIAAAMGDEHVLAALLDIFCNPEKGLHTITCRNGLLRTF